MNRWEYLSTPVFKSRYALAAHFIPKQVRDIVEIGGYKNCIAEFLPICNGHHVFAVDPLLDVPFHMNTKRFPMSICNFDVSLLSKPYAVVAMGFDISDSRELDAARCLIGKADVAVVETAIGHKVGMDFLEEVVRIKKDVMCIDMDLSENRIETEGYPPFTKRRMIVSRRTI